jgi:hypothetical protein
MQPAMDACWAFVLMYIIIANFFLYVYFKQFMNKRTTPSYSRIVNEIFSFLIIAGMIYVFIFRGLIGLLLYFIWGIPAFFLRSQYTDVVDISAIIFITILTVWTARRISRKYDKELTS